MNNKIKVLSLFDGMSCGQIALTNLGYDCEYYAAEIKKSAIEVTKHNFPKTIHIGDVTKVSYSNGVLSTEVGEFDIDFDLVIGGSPCQDFSNARTSAGLSINGLNGGKSKLFYEYLRVLNEIKCFNPDVKFLLENVKMKKGSKELLDEYMGVDGFYVCSSEVSFQTRARYYWTNIKKPSTFNRVTGSFQEEMDRDFEYCDKFKVKRTPSRENMWNNGEGRTNLKACKNISDSELVGCLTRKQDRAPNSGLINHGDFCRYLTRREMEKAQTVPVGYTDILSYNQAQDVLGDGWTVSVVEQIFKGIDAV